ncbi:MAG: PEP/pyruvate-binding domain-containing protein [Candidatus Firestonebacteria bacterium]
MKYICLINTLAKKDAAISGSKAALLGEIQRAGVKTPSGFVITAAAWDKLLKKNKITALISSNNLPAARENILKAIIPENIKTEILEAFRKMGVSRVAVRSSSPFEDTLRGAAAGQFDTFLNVSEEKLLESVKKVWASTFSARAVSYAKQNGVDIKKLSMAVLVQGMIESEVSGVAFSINPATLDERFVVIEACKGLGDKLVEGRITPDRFTVKKNNLSVMENGYMLSKEKLANSLLSDPELKRISSHVICLEKYFGFHTDTEWALCRGELYFLQCRPVTTLKKLKNNTDVWSNMNIAEVLPGQNYPLVVSFCLTIIEIAVKTASGMPAESEIIRGVKGRLYFNLSAIEDHFRNNLGIKNFSAALLFGGEKTENPKPGRIRLKYMPKLFKLGFGLLVSSLRMQRWLKKFTRDIPNITKEWEKEAEKTVTFEEIIELKKIIINHCRNDIAKSFGALMIPLIWIDIYNRVAKKMMKKAEDRHILLSGEFNKIEILSGFKLLWKISRMIKADEKLAVEFLKTEDTAEAEVVINRDLQIKASYDKFMEDYGYRCVKEIDFSQPRWGEDRGFIINNLKTYVKAPDNLSPEKREQDLLLKRRELLDKLKKEMPLWKVSMLSWLSGKARKGQNSRELIKGSLIRIFVPFRKVILKMAELLIEKKLIEESTDIFFLLEEEFDRLDSDISPLRHISGRKLEYLKNRDIYLPDVITDLDLLVGKGQYEPSPDIKELKGLAVSQGRITGTARVIMRAEDIGRIIPGDILVTDHTDPGWTPVFVTISALVTNTGGLLSHASIVAREYGLPAVVNVLNATKIIKDGDTLEVDGNNGIVKIL